MTIQLIPPLGLIFALTGAGMAAFWSLPSGPFPKSDRFDGATLGEPVGDEGDHFRLPEPFDADEAIRHFATRPLLAEGRKPFVPAAEDEPIVEAPPPEPAPAIVVEALPPPRIHMLGVMESDGKHRALIEDEVAGAQLWLAVGDAIQGWTLTEIADDQIRLQVEDAEISFNLFEMPLP